MNDDGVVIECVIRACRRCLSWRGVARSCLLLEEEAWLRLPALAAAEERKVVAGDEWSW